MTSSARCALLLLLALGAGGCADRDACAELGAPSGLADAALITVAVYRAPAMCQGPEIIPPSATPLQTASGPSSAPLSLRLPAGDVFVQVRAYRDAAGTELLASGCSFTHVRDGETSCLELPVVAPGTSGSDGGACTPLTHSNGVGQTYLDCAPLGTFDPRLAQAACAVFAGDGALCRTIGCSGSANEVAVCSKDADDCVCWSYTGASAGHVRDAAGGGCECPTDADPSWN